MYIYIVYTGKPFQIQINYFKTWFSGFYTQLTYFQLLTTMHLFFCVSTKMGSEGCFYFILNLTTGKKKEVLQLQHGQREILQREQVKGREKYCSTEQRGEGAGKGHSFTYILRILLHLLHHFSRPQDLLCR